MLGLSDRSGCLKPSQPSPLRPSTIFSPRSNRPNRRRRCRRWSPLFIPQPQRHQQNWSQEQPQLLLCLRNGRYFWAPSKKIIFGRKFFLFFYFLLTTVSHAEQRRINYRTCQGSFSHTVFISVFWRFDTGTVIDYF